MFSQSGRTPHFVIFFRVEEQVDDLVYQENMLCPIVLGHICRW